ncbi:SDR family oxidoreductase [Emcibacter sp.]|uniref:SDR family NAD(P)-dependent oxidoreductase n=1 Tax=Emcibacter sp. TaxID=1979954 RepID=UPI002AA8C004|nr:SDR family oxidoreductase [Emcibacter sp.]
MNLELNGKKAIITGATRGIGRRIANLLAEEGVDLAICARDEEEVAEAAAELSKTGVKAVGKAVNVRDGDAYKAWLSEAADALGGCDIFVPNVSAGGGMDSEKNWIKNFEIDVMGTVRGCETLMPHLEQSDSASVVLISSTNALEFFAGPMAYNAMKAALINYAKQLAIFVGNKGIRVNSVCPGPVYFDGGAWEMIKGTNPKFYDKTVRAIPRGEMGTPEEIANVVAFLASPKSSVITGSNIVADAGYTKRVQY